MARKTKLMRQAELQEKRSLEEFLAPLINEIGLSATADRLGISKATLGYWLLKLGITVKRIAVVAGETVEVKRAV